METEAGLYKIFQPEATIELECKDGSLAYETFRFSCFSDFNVPQLTAQSPLLKDLRSEEDANSKIAMQAQKNMLFKKVFEQSQMKAAFIQVLTGMVAEIEQHEQ